MRSWPSFLSPLFRVYFYRFVKTPLLSQVFELITKPTHVVSSFTLSFPLFIVLYNGLVFTKFHSTSASPCTSESITLFTVVSLALSSNTVMFFEWMFAKTLKIISSMGWNIIKTFTFTLLSFAWGFLCIIIKVVVIFEFVIAKAFCLWAYHLALLALNVPPA